MTAKTFTLGIAHEAWDVMKKPLSIATSLAVTAMLTYGLSSYFPGTAAKALAFVSGFVGSEIFSFGMRFGALAIEAPFKKFDNFLERHTKRYNPDIKPIEHFYMSKLAGISGYTFGALIGIYVAGGILEKSGTAHVSTNQPENVRPAPLIPMQSKAGWRVQCG